MVSLCDRREEALGRKSVGMESQFHNSGYPRGRATTGVRRGSWILGFEAWKLRKKGLTCPVSGSKMRPISVAMRSAKTAYL